MKSLKLKYFFITLLLVALGAVFFNAGDVGNRASNFGNSTSTSYDFEVSNGALQGSENLTEDISIDVDDNISFHLGNDDSTESILDDTGASERGNYRS